jgi:uncharacterized protein (DUF885 family)
MRRALLPILFLLTTGCMTTPIPQDEFTAFENDYFESLFQAAPSYGVLAGFHQFDNAVEDFSEAAIQRRLRVLRAQQQRLAGIPQASLTQQQQIDYEILASQIKAEIHETADLETWRKNPLSYAGAAGNAIDVIMKRNFAPAQERVRSALVRLHGIPFMLEAMKANVRNPPREFTELAIRIAAGSVGFFRDDIAKWGKESAGADIVLHGQFEVANETAAKALEDAAKWLRDDLLPRSKGNYAIGSEAFSRKLLYEEMVDTPLREILAIGERNLAKDYDAFVQTAKQIDPKKTPAEVMASLADNHPAAADLLPAVRRNSDSIRQFLIDRDLVTIPSPVRASIVETPPFMRSGTFAAMDTPGAYEKKATEAYYYITPPEKNWPARQIEEHLRLFNKYVIDVVTIHEAYPGHYVQFLYAPRFPTKTRKLVVVGTNAEGWAHYTEQMMIEEGFGAGDPRYKLAQLSEALLRDCRYVAGIKLHTEGWTVEQATRLFMEKGFQERANALEEARRGTYNPTYLYYTLGKLQIYKLRADYQVKRGASYRLKDFHDTFLSQGSIPLKMVRRVMLGEDGKLL